MDKGGANPKSRSANMDHHPYFIPGFVDCDLQEIAREDHGNQIYDKAKSTISGRPFASRDSFPNVILPKNGNHENKNRCRQDVPSLEIGLHRVV